MFLLHFLPDSFLHTIINLVLFSGLGLTVVGFFLIGWIPGARNYKSLIQILGVVMLVLGIYWKGGYGVEMEWREKVRLLEEKVKIAEEKSKQVNTVVKERVVTKIQKVKEVKYKNRDVIKQVEKIIDKDCTVPPEAIDILNAAARNEAVVLKGLDQ